MKYAIIAAGEGSRLAEEGIAQPKPLVPILGEPMLARLVRIFMQNETEEVAVIVNRLTPVTEQFVREKMAGEWNGKVRLVVKTTPSSMHSFYALAPYLAGAPFCLTTVDTIFREEDFGRYIAAFRASDADGLMGVTDFIDDEKPLYVGTKGTEITGFYDSPTADSRYISGGIYALRPTALPLLEQCIASGQSRMRNFQRALVAGGLHLEAYPFGKILDVDHAADIAKAESFLQSH